MIIWTLLAQSSCRALRASFICKVNKVAESIFYPHHPHDGQHHRLKGSNCILAPQYYTRSVLMHHSEPGKRFVPPKEVSVNAFFNWVWDWDRFAPRSPRVTVIRFSVVIDVCLCSNTIRLWSYQHTGVRASEDITGQKYITFQCNLVDVIWEETLHIDCF